MNAPFDADAVAEAAIRYVEAGGAPLADWQQDWQRNADGVPLPNLANTLLAMRKAPELSQLVRRDEMLRADVLVHAVPGQADAANERFIPRPVQDADVTAIQELLQLTGLRRVGKDTVHQAGANQSCAIKRRPLLIRLAG